MSEAKHTPIEQWIEENRNKCYPKQKGITNTESNKSMAKKVAFTRGCKELLTYLGLSGIENPREWVEKINQSAAILPLMEGMINFLNDVKNEGKSFTSRINMLENENDAVDIVLWACPADVAGNPIQRIMDLANERNQLQSEITKLQSELKSAKANNRAEELLSLIDEESIIDRNIKLFNDLRKDKPKAFDTDTIHKTELKQAKAEAWDEGLKSGKNYVESSMSCDEGVRLPENPYKPDFNQNSMFERFGDLEQEFKVE